MNTTTMTTNKGKQRGFFGYLFLNGIFQENIKGKTEYNLLLFHVILSAWEIEQ